jgi:hypothetical protein
MSPNALPMDRLPRQGGSRGRVVLPADLGAVVGKPGATAVATTSTLTFNGALVTALCQRDPALGYDLSMRFLQVMGDRLQTTRMRLARFHRSVGRRTTGMPAGWPRPATGG